MRSRGGRLFIFIIVTKMLFGVWCADVRAAGLLSTLSNASALSSFANPLVLTVGLALDHRPYQSATPLGTSIGLDVGVELTLVQVPTSFNTAITGSAGGTSIPILPSPQLHLHKGIGDRVDIGATWISFEGNGATGFDLKICVAKPEEGPTWAIRFNYTIASAELDPVTINTNTFTPQILVGKQMEFADPYLGVGYQYAWGTLNITLPTGLPSPAPQSITSTNNGTGGGFQAFTGVALKIPNTGIKLTLEGSYSSVGANTLGTKFGFEF